MHIRCVNIHTFPFYLVLVLANGPSFDLLDNTARAPMLGQHQQTSKNDASGFKAKGGAADILNAVNMEVTQEALMDNVKGELEQTAKAEYKDKLAEWESAQKKAQIAEKDDYDDLDEDDDFMEQMKQKRLDDLQKKCVASARKLWGQQRSSTGSGARARTCSVPQRCVAHAHAHATAVTGTHSSGNSTRRVTASTARSPRKSFSRKCAARSGWWCTFTTASSSGARSLIST